MHSLVIKATAAGFACAALIGCSASGTLTPTATADLQQALATSCPILSAIQSANLALNAYQKSALTTLALACPPNPPPTSAAVAVGDIIEAFVTLQPLLKS